MTEFEQNVDQGFLASVMIRAILFWLLVSASALATIKPGDALTLSIKGVPAKEKSMVDGRYVVGSNGQIKIPIADVMVTAKGLSHDQLARRIENAFKKHGIYLRPTITIESNNTRRAEGAFVSVGGRVKRAGPVQFRTGLTVLQAIQAAGDLGTFATRKRIFLTRKGKRTVLDLRKVKHQNFILQPDDTLVVDQKKPFEVN